jgi:hypothetical protein
VAGLWLLVAAFRVGIGWGFAVLFLGPLGALIFVIQNWEESKTPFKIWVFGLVLFAGGFGLSYLGVQQAGGQGSFVDAIPGAGRVMSEEGGLSSALEKLSGSGGSSEYTQESAQSFLGKPLESALEELGRPKGRMSSKDGKTMLLYDDFTLVSDDGRTITDVTSAEEYEPIPVNDQGELVPNEGTPLPE